MTLNFQSIKFCKTTEEFQQRVCANFNTNLNQLDQDVGTLKDWLKSQPHLPQCSSDTMLKSYLLACKNKMEKAKTKISNYYTVRAEMPEIFSERDPTCEKITEDGEIIHLYTLPKLTPDGCVVNMFSFTTTEAKKFNTTAFAKRSIMAEDVKMNMEPFVNGGYYVFDGRYLSMSHVLKVTPSFIGNMVHWGQNVLPIIIKGIIFINSPAYMEIILGILKPFMKSKLFQRIHVHTGGAEVLEKYFPRALLPRDYGGEEVSSEELNESWLRCLRENREWFLRDGQLKATVNKSKVSLEKKEQFEELRGSFKTLCID